MKVTVSYIVLDPALRFPKHGELRVANSAIEKALAQIECSGLAEMRLIVWTQWELREHILEDLDSNLRGTWTICGWG